MESKRDGFETGEFGRKLSMRLKGNTNFSVYYDHGDPKDGHVVAIKGFYGSEVENANRLADIDILIASEDRNAKLLIEIEESPSSPKKILGDVMAALMCDHVDVTDQPTFKITQDTRLIVAGVVPDQGTRIDKLEKIIEPRIHSLPAFTGGISPGKVNLIFTATLTGTIGKLTEIIEESIEKDLT